MKSSEGLESIRDRLFDRDAITRNLRAARLGKTYPEYSRYLLVQTALTAGCAVLFVIVSHLFQIRFTALEVFPGWTQDLIVLAVPTLLVFLVLHFTPLLVARGRKTRIDLDLPYAVTYMQALASTLTLYNVIRSVYEQQELYGEVSREFGMIVRDVELFGDDLVSAMQNLGRTTPSENLRKLLDDLVLMFESGGDLAAFLASRSAHYREVAENELEMALKTMEIMAEVYVTAFVAAPIAVIIMIVAENMSGQSQLSALMPYFYLFLPLGAAAMVWTLTLVVPEENVAVSRRVTRDTEFGGDVPVRAASPVEDRVVAQQVRAKRRLIHAAEVLRHPIRHYMSDYRFGILFGAIGVCGVVLLFFLGFIDPAFSKYPFEVFACLAIIAFLAPLMAAYEIRRIYVHRVESQVPEFLRELADLKDIGMTLQGAVRLISESKIGILSTELRLVSDDVKFGTSITSALVRMEERIGVLAIKRVISLIIRASEVTDYIRDILIIAVNDMEHYLKMQRDRYTVSFAYIMIIYLSFAIFLYTAYQLNVSFISAFKNLNTNVDISGNVLDMFHISIILGLFSGIMAGQLSSGNILSGFKHAVLFLVATVVIFVYIL